MERENGMEFLAALPREVVEAVAKNMIKVALSRADLIQEVMDKLPPLPENSRGSIGITPIEE
jgi:hypothetical protein